MISSRYPFFPPTIEKRLTTVQEDNIHGATRLTLQSAEILLEFIQTYRGNHLLDFQRLLKALSHRLVKSQPSMISIFTLTNQLLLHLDETAYSTLGQIKHDTDTLIQDFIKSLGSAQESINQALDHLLTSYENIYTYSHSGTVVEGLLSIKKRENPMNVQCSEARPNNEGLDLATRLSNHHIPVSIMTDAEFFSSIHHADVILIGADAVKTTGVINKTGSYPLAILASYHDIPFYVVCMKEKMVPASYKIPTEQNRNVQEIMKKIPKKVTVKNHYFDSVPLELCTGFLSQSGLLTSDDILSDLKHLEVHPTLLE